MQKSPRKPFRSRLPHKTTLGWIVGCGTVIFLLSTIWLAKNIHRQLNLSSREREGYIRAQPSTAFCLKPRPPLVCAHGGDTTSAPSNTAAAFQAAINMGADCVEVDVARTRDGVLVVLHVRELQELVSAWLLSQQHPHARSEHGESTPPSPRMLPGDTHTPWGVQLSQLQVGDLSWGELQRLRWPGTDQGVLRVAEAITLTSPYVDCVTLDIKTYVDSSGTDTDVNQLVNAVVHLVHETGCHNCLVWAKSDDVVGRVKALSPGQRAGLIAMNHTHEARGAGMHLPLRMLGPEVVGAHWGMVDPEMATLLADHGKLLFTWTVNEAWVMAQVLDAGVDAIVTNEVAMAQEAVAYRLARCGEVLARSRLQQGAGSPASPTSARVQEGGL